MHYANIKYNDIANGSGVRTSLFVSGCTHHCKNCFNEIAWDFNYGPEFTQDTIDEILDSIAPAYIAGLSLLGGEPMEPANQKAILPLLEQFHDRFPNKDVWCYTGYTYETDILAENGRAHTSETQAILNYINVLVDGKFIEELKDITLQFRGSSNQRIIKLH